MNEFFKELGELLAKHNVEIDIDFSSRGYESVATGIMFTRYTMGEYAEVLHPHLNLDSDDCQEISKKPA